MRYQHALTGHRPKKISFGGKDLETVRAFRNESCVKPSYMQRRTNTIQLGVAFEQAGLTRLDSIVGLVCGFVSCLLRIVIYSNNFYDKMYP